MPDLTIRAVERPGDDDALWAILEPVVREGLTYPVDPDASREESFAYWFAPDKTAYVAERNGEVLGTYYLRPNSTGPAAHVANAGYMVRPDARGLGVARAMAEDSFTRAKRQGYLAMQFNLVVATNESALHLWQSVGMKEVGRVEHAFCLPGGDFADAIVMHRLL